MCRLALADRTRLVEARMEVTKSVSNNDLPASVAVLSELPRFLYLHSTIPISETSEKLCPHYSTNSWKILAGCQFDTDSRSNSNMGVFKNPYCSLCQRSYCIQIASIDISTSRKIDHYTILARRQPKTKSRPRLPTARYTCGRNFVQSTV
jgi:hypothetical protein